jgi:hypothetical protein
VAAGVGYCGLDRSRAPLRGDEIRACWDDPRSAKQPPPGDPAPDWLPDVDPSTPVPPPTGTLPVVSPARDSVLPSRGARLWVEVDV